MRERLRFAVLGPVRAWRGADEIELGPPQQRAVLAALLLAEGAQVSTDSLVDAVWGTRAPATAVGTLRTYVHRLRKVLEPGGDTASSVIRSMGDGYRIRTSPDELDLGAFRDLLAQADRVRGAGELKDTERCLRDALDLWRGTALAGIRGDYAEGQRQRLGELRLSATAARLEIALDLGAHADAATELAGLVGEHPLDERFREMLMLALYQSGRQAAALTTYREAQTLLAEELGVDPGPALQEMYQRILRADAELLTSPSALTEPTPAPAPVSAQAPGVPAQLPADLPAFVGRDAELAQMAGLMPSGTVVIGAIAGMAGVGKTAFAVHWARQVADRFPDGQLYLNLRGFDPVGRPVTPEHALRTVLEALGMESDTLPQHVDALAGVYRTVLAGRRVLLLLDNARDAAQVRPLLPGAPGCLVIVTSRNRLTGLVAVDGAHPVRLDVLSLSEARDFLVRRLGADRVAAEPDAVQEIIERCARLPLALAVTAAHAAAWSTFPLAAIAAGLRDSAGGLDAFHDADSDSAADVRAVFSWSYHALTPDAAHLFRLLALHPGPDIALPAAASLAGLTVPHARRLLGELIRANLVDESAPARFASHDLLRAYAAELADAVDPPAERRAARHRMFDHYLHSAYAAAESALLIRHHIQITSRSAGVRPEEFADSEQRALAWFAREQAVLVAAVLEAAETGFDEHTWQLAWTIEHYLGRRGMWRDLEITLHTAMAAARRLGDPTPEAHALRGLAQAERYTGHVKESRAHLERAIELFGRIGDMTALAECHRQLSGVLELAGELEPALHHAELCVELLPDTPENSKLLGWARTGIGWYHALLGRYEEALVHCRAALDFVREAGDDYGEAYVLDSIGYAQHHLGRYTEAITSYERALLLIRQVGGVPWSEAAMLTHLGDSLLSVHRPDAARAAWTEGLSVLEQLRHPDAEQLRVKLRELPG
ncbi:AfsR/SARP family transcriptional regulator [Streptomyces canus]|uniref:AfsR/SARP family transcriptional regulator n=1 Tax=Streptomyces canus TaxID=58343 RepID=UPI0037F75E93